jgi:hypothetical protein
MVAFVASSDRQRTASSRAGWPSSIPVRNWRASRTCAAEISQITGYRVPAASIEERT